jgi:hypothetical protein
MTITTSRTHFIPPRQDEADREYEEEEREKE